MGLIRHQWKLSFPIKVWVVYGHLINYVQFVDLESSKYIIIYLKFTSFISVNPLQIFGKISIYAISVFTIFLVTLACFPALTLLTGSVNGNEYKVWATKYFIPVSTIIYKCILQMNMYFAKISIKYSNIWDMLRFRCAVSFFLMSVIT